MRLFAISDLHLPGGQGKDMDMFGLHWGDHWEKIKADWWGKVGQDDAVLIPGDISWAMTMDQAREDLNAIRELPGYKVLLRGNHDYWWGSVTRVREALGKQGYALQNDAIALGDWVICGSRGWSCPGKSDYTADDERIYRREGERMRLSLKDAARRFPDKSPLVMMHFPPFNDRQDASVFTELFAEYGVRQVLYGHLHGPGSALAFEGERNGCTYRLVSCDYLHFTLAEIF
nr:metallophosphoesterase [bacterium]